METLRKCCASDADEETVAQQFVGKIAVIAGLNKVIESGNILFHRSVCLLNPSVKASLLKNNVF